ncbi:hypothetical protein ACIRPK_23525 [Kitasatospora sp. NPDC101801]|uniref:hypothetical protein n=1 Tax=Kitasatospora sp. NPDC101801 TaxID=3364103 RepID=UPI003817E5BF
MVLPVLVDLRPADSFALVMLWGFGPPILAAGVAWVVHGVGRLRAPWLYQFRGVRVMARLDRLREQPDGDGDGSHLKGKYAFVDLDGRPRSLERIVSRGARIGDRIELCYVPDHTRLVDTGTRYGAEIAGRSAVLVLLALPVALVGAAMTIGPIVIALSV